MKKLISLLLVSLMLFTLCACNQTDVSEEQNPDFTAEYLTDPDVMIIDTQEDIDEKAIKKHYADGKIILVKDWTLASEVQDMIATTMTAYFSEKDLAVAFYKTASGVPGVSALNSNSTTLDVEIDEMIADAKTQQ